MDKIINPPKITDFKIACQAIHVEFELTMRTNI
jgi:hypothetical protein